MTIDEKIKVAQELFRERQEKNMDVEFLKNCAKKGYYVEVRSKGMNARKLGNFDLKELGEVVFDALAKKIEKRLAEIDAKIESLNISEEVGR